MDSTFKNKKIILGVTGGIAAYKACLIVRRLVSQGAEVRVVMTPSALEFITPLTLSTLSGSEVIVNVFPPTQKDGVDFRTWHIDYALWADLMIIAPATNNTIAKMANGFADNALTTLAAALRSPLLIAPAADMDMYKNSANRNNIEKLKNDGAFIVDAEEGFLASGLKGPGRMADVEKICDAAELVLTGHTKDLEGKKLLVTAGPTYEDIDPVRFIGNRSSGKMGFEVAKAAYLRGAEVTLISGPSSLTAYPEIKRIDVRSAEEMKAAIDKELSNNDALVMSAAVADFKPKEYVDKKIKKDKGFDAIELTKTDDILGSINKGDAKVVGFALETDNAEENAKRKLNDKNLDMIVLNSLQDDGSGFEHDTNKITIYTSDDYHNFALLSKFITANNILTHLAKLFK